MTAILEPGPQLQWLKWWEDEERRKKGNRAVGIVKDQVPGEDPHSELGVQMA